jgi:hypothetical protein
MDHKTIDGQREFYENLKTVEEFEKKYNESSLILNLNWIMEVCPIWKEVVQYICKNKVVLDDLEEKTILAILLYIVPAHSPKEKSLVREKQEAFYQLYLTKTKGRKFTLEDVLDVEDNSYLYQLNK